MSSTKAGKPGLDGKKEYQSPQLVCYGDVALVTRGGKGAMSDAHGAGTRLCHAGWRRCCMELVPLALNLYVPV